MQTLNSARKGQRRLLTLIALFVGVLGISLWVQSVVPENDANAEIETVPIPIGDKIVDVPLADNVLSAEKQKYIWDTEHTTFALETYFGKAFRQAMQDRDAAAMAKQFADQTSILALPHEATDKRSVAPLTEWATSSETTKPEPLATEAFVQVLLERNEPIEQIERTGLRVLTLDQTAKDTWSANVWVECFGRTSDGRWHYWESKQDLQFRFASNEQIHDGHIITTWKEKSRSTRTSESPLMREVTAQTGLDNLPLRDNWKVDSRLTSQYSFQVAVADFDKDDYPDIVAAPFDGTPILLRSDRCETFVDVTEAMQLRSWRPDPKHLLSLAAWIDFDNDSWPDLLLGDRLYRNQKGQAFEDVTPESGLVVGHHAMGATVADYDCDGWLDLYILYQHDPQKPLPPTPKPWVGDIHSGIENRLWRNLGGGRFRDVTEESGAGGGDRESFAATWHFLNADRFPDLYIANDFGQNVHLLNRGDGTFEDVSNTTGTSGYATSMGVASGDLNNDGQPELYVANMFSKMGRRIIQHVDEEDYSPGIYDQIYGSCAGNQLYSPRGNGPHREMSFAAGVNQVGWAYAPAIADLNADGLLDIYATTGFMSFNRKKPDG